MEPSDASKLGSPLAITTIMPAIARSFEHLSRMLDAVIATSKDQICVFDREGCFLYVGVAEASMLGMERADILGKTGQEIGLPTRYTDRLQQERIQVFSTGEPCFGSIAYPTLQGERLYEYTMSPLRGADRQIEAVIVRSQDVTERDQQKERLHHSEERLRLALEGADMGTWHWDFLSRRFTWSARTLQIFDVPSGATITLDLMLGRIHPADRERVRASVYRALNAALDYHAEFRVLRSNGEERWVMASGHTFYDARGNALTLEGVALDVTERKQAEQALRTRAEVLDNMAEGVVMTDIHAVIVFTNPAFDAMFGYATGELLGKPSSVLNDADPEEYPTLLREMLGVLEERGQWTGEFKNRRKDGTPFLTRARISSLQVAGETYLISVQEDITEDRRNAQEREAANQWLREANRRLEEQVLINQQQQQELQNRKAELEEINQKLEILNIHLVSQATTDGLTGLKNHRAFQEQLVALFEQSRRYQRAFSILLIDVDRFKPFNDTFGHPAGDEVLKQVASVLQSAARQADFVARYGGEEFILILPETDAEGAGRVAERIRAALAESAWEQREITVSTGVATLTEAMGFPAQLLEAADKALYASKAAGRDCITHFHAETMFE